MSGQGRYSEHRNIGVSALYRNFELLTRAGVQVTVAVEREQHGMTFPYCASLTDAGERRYMYGKTPSQAVRALFELIGERPCGDLRDIDVAFGEALPSLLLRQAC